MKGGKIDTAIIMILNDYHFLFSNREISVAFRLSDRTSEPGEPGSNLDGCIFFYFQFIGWL